jgi:hypothetical protein
VKEIGARQVQMLDRRNLAGPMYQAQCGDNRGDDASGHVQDAQTTSSPPDGQPEQGNYPGCLRKAWGQSRQESPSTLHSSMMRTHVQDR